ncbi:MAG TPA: 50S ribosomal protein L17 [Thermodesulfobacteriota bacterium]|nr:50S ribosomal protein L17 [Candidatus Paceibacterota bacterium]HVY55172.1 50S ribosomal protein L17 [Thermodesulfobacteriota bacterium]
MRHHEKFRILGREKGQRAALVRSLVRSLIIHEGITTTEAKAKELRKFIEPMVTKAKNGTLASRRLLVSRIGDAKAAKKLVEVIAPAHKARTGGYTRVIKLPLRKSDGAKMAHIQFVK